MKSYKDLEIYQPAYELAIEVHQMTMELPKYELYEQGSQIRRSSKRIKDTIAERYGRRRYKGEFVRFLIFAHSSCDETISQRALQNHQPTALRELYSRLMGIYGRWYNHLGAKHHVLQRPLSIRYD